MAKFDLGDAVEYRDSSGFTKLAFVSATRKTVAKGTAVSRPEKGSAHLVIFSPTGKTYTRSNVVYGDGPKTFSRV